MYDILKKRTTGLKDDVVDFARELVHEPSPSLEEEALSLIICERMKALGYDKVFRDDFGNVVGIIFGYENGPVLLLNSHMDTMPPGDRQQWHSNPYGAEICDGKLYGCGASDCKGGLAAQVYAGAMLKHSLLPLKGTLVVAATVGQERGGDIGICGLMEKTLPQLELEPAYVILGEPTELGIYYGHDGWLEVEVSLEGRNWLNVCKAADTVIGEFNGRAFRKTHCRTENISTGNGDGARAAIGMIQRINYLDDIDSVIGRIRREALLLTRDDEDDVKIEVAVCQEVQRTYTGQSAVVKKITHAWSIDPFDPLIELSRTALRAAGCAPVMGKWELGRNAMGTAGGILLKNYGIASIGYGPGDEAAAHAPNEYVETDKIVEAVYGTTVIAQSIIGIPVFGWTSAEI